MKSLIPPYIFWNLEVIFIFFLAQTFLPSFVSGKNTLVMDYTFMDWLSAFWTPVCGQFWYIRDLFIVIVLSPLINCIIKKIPVFIVILGGMWLFNIRHEPISFSSTSFFFFSLGAFFSDKKINYIIGNGMLKSRNRWGYALTVLYIFTMVMLFNHQKGFYDSGFLCVINNVGILLMCVSFVNITDQLLIRKRLQMNDFLSKSSFFIYAFHSMFLLFVEKKLIYLLYPMSDFEALIIYIISPLITIVVGLIAFSLLKKTFPKFTMVITGKRA